MITLDGMKPEYATQAKEHNPHVPALEGFLEGRNLCGRRSRAGSSRYVSELRGGTVRFEKRDLAASER